MPFPAEIYHHILAQLPPIRHSDSSVYTLLNCSEVNSLLLSASTTALLWRSHYQVRYKHNDERKEEERRSKIGSNWRALYIERRRLESQALDVLKEVILGNTESFRPCADKDGHDEDQAPWLQVVGRSIVQLGMDIYDMLDVIQRTAPRMLKGAPDEVELEYEHPTSPWKSWAMYLKGLILRHDAIRRWIHMKDSLEEMPFERTLAGLSAFYGVSYVEVSEALDSLASECQSAFASSSVPIPENPAELSPYEVTEICERICAFMRSKHFAACRKEMFEGITKDRIGPLTQYSGFTGFLVPPGDLFPHRFISVSMARTNIPMALVYVFVAICRRFNIAASATNFPSRVLAHVAPGGGLPDFWVDVFSSETPCVLQRDDVLQIWNRVSDFADLRMFTQSTEPCSPKSSLVRQANNILASVHRLPSGSFERSATIYPVATILCLFGTMQWPTGFGVVPDIDLEAILGALVAPRLQPDNIFHNTLKSWTIWEGLSYSVYRRENDSHAGTMVPKYFVGMVVGSNDFTTACITNWIAPLSDQGGILYKLQVPIEGDPCGQIAYRLEIQLRPVYSKSAFDQVRDAPWLGLHFSGIETSSDQGLMRFIMNPYLRRRFPDDDEYGKKWLEENRKME